MSQADAIDRAAAAVADAIAGGHRVYVAATSHVLHSELYLRAGGLAAVHTLGEAPDLASPMLSIEAGMLRGDGPFVPEPGDVVIVGTNAGTDAGTVQVAIAARDAGLTVIGMTCVAYERHPDVVVEHPSGAKLVDLADIVIDVGGDVGDAVLDIPGLEERFAPDVRGRARGPGLGDPRRRRGAARGRRFAAARVPLRPAPRRRGALPRTTGALRTDPERARPLSRWTRGALSSAPHEGGHRWTRAAS